MIDAETGKIRIDKYEIVIGPSLTVADFESANIPIKHKVADSIGYWTTFYFDAPIDGMDADILLQFRRQLVYMLIFDPIANDIGEKWDDLDASVQQRFLTEWLTKVTRRPPPYNYEWGTINVGRDDHNGSFSIYICYKYDIEDELGPRRDYIPPSPPNLRSGPKTKGLPPGFKAK